MICRARRVRPRGVSAAHCRADLRRLGGVLVGAWRHVGAVLGSRDPRSDAAALARLTGVPPVLWLGSFVLALGLASWLAAAELLGAWS